MLAPEMARGLPLSRRHLSAWLLGGVMLTGILARASWPRTTSAGADEMPSDAPVVCRVERSPRSGGGTVLRGHSRFGVAASSSTRVDEYVELDASGSLIWAEIRVVGHDETILTLDAARGLVTRRARGRADTRHLGTELPWVYVPPSSEAHLWLTTPIAAFVALRATDARAVRLFDPDGGDAAIMSDQIAARDSEHAWVALGDDLATFALDDHGEARLTELHLAAFDARVTDSGR
jgi:hypothetical protein